MRFKMRYRPCSLVSILLLMALFEFDPAWSQPGTLLSHQKISNTMGNFTAALDNLDEFGGAVVGLGDLDGPGPSVAAVAVGAAADDDGGTDRGAAYVLFLAPTGLVLSHQKISDLAGNFTAVLDNADDFGGSVAYLGDLDGVGPSVAALAVGAPFDDDGGINHGAVYVLFLAPTGLVLSHQKISDTVGGFPEPLAIADEFGGALASLGDLDGAGPSVAALAVGAIGDDDGGTDRGATYVLFLGATGSVLSYQKISDTVGGFPEPLADADEFGGALGGLGDLDGAGPSAAALAVGAPGDDDGGTDRGCVYVLFLSSTGTVLSDRVISDTQGGFIEPLANGDGFGTAVGSLGDLDVAGPSALALSVGAAADDDGGTDRGAVYNLFLDAIGNVLSHTTISDAQGGFPGQLADVDEFGGAVAALGDLDGPGPSAQALVSGAVGDDDGGAQRGAVYVLFLQGTVVADAPDPLSEATNMLGGARPNPFQPHTTIPFRTTEPGWVRIGIWDVGGRLVRTLVERRLDAGEHRATWNGLDETGRRLAPGTYFYSLSVNGRSATAAKKAVLLE